MKFPVFYEGKEVGWVDAEQENYSASWEAACKVETEGVLRLYGIKTDRQPLRIGVLEPVPEEGTLHLCRSISKSEMEAAGYDTLPEAYILTETGQVSLHTGDAKLDALVDAGQAVCRLCDGKICVSVPFKPGEACRMAFALTACTIQNGEAVLRGNKTGLFKIQV